jgi:demethylmenaquinone methyltransferase/2-methoxy-6-polyprenyl-1,4-benzoquinol methylase
MLRTRYSYDHYAWCYEWIASVFSLGAIPRVKASQVAALEPGQRVLYVGVGAGEDALLAARRGLDLTCLDLSQPMLRRLAGRLDAAGLKAELIHDDILDHTVDARYDAIVANFVLNVFSQETLAVVMRHIASLLAPGGRLLIADFTPPGEGPTRRFLYGCYYRPINWVAWALQLCALHPIYDYASYLEDAGLRLTQRTTEALWRGGSRIQGPRLFETLTAEPATAEAAPTVSRLAKAD